MSVCGSGAELMGGGCNIWLLDFFFFFLRSLMQM